VRVGVLHDQAKHAARIAHCKVQCYGRTEIVDIQIGIGDAKLCQRPFDQIGEAIKGRVGNQGGLAKSRKVGCDHETGL
jgi:hypothetical protein